MRKSQFHSASYPLRNSFSGDLFLAKLVPIMSGFVIYPHTSRRTRCTEPVYANPGANLVLSPRIIISPVMKLLVYPCKQCYWTISQCKSKCRWFCGLFCSIARTLVKEPRCSRKALLLSFACILLYFSYAILFDRVVAFTLAGSSGTVVNAKDCKPTTTKVPQYFQTSPELWAGPTATGKAPFLAQTNPVFFAPSATFIPNSPLETAEPIVGQGENDESIHRLMGQLSPYFPNPDGFGVSEYPLPAGANITQVQVSHPCGPTLEYLSLSNSDALQAWVEVSDDQCQCVFSW